jgi:hypothetical protein
MFAAGTQPHEFSNPDKLTPAGKMFWADLTRRQTEAQQSGYRMNWQQAVADAKNAVIANTRQQAAQTKAPAPKTRAQARPGDVSGSVHAPSAPVRNNQGKTLEEQLRAVVQTDAATRKKLGLT